MLCEADSMKRDSSKKRSKSHDLDISFYNITSSVVRLHCKLVGTAVDLTFLSHCNNFCVSI